MKNVGTHLRLYNSLTELAEHAIRLDIKIFQSFLFFEKSKKYIKLSSQDIKTFLNLRRDNFEEVFLHGSYFINFCFCNQPINPVFKKELTLAKKLEFTHMIIHPGYAKFCKTKTEAIDTLAKNLNAIFKKEKDIKIVLENTAHGSLSVGSDFDDFKKLLTKIDKPELLGFCIDTAHAYLYGYDFLDLKKLKYFIKIIEDSIGLDSISLIHLNDTKEKLGSKIDRHCRMGIGNIPKKILQNFSLKFKNVPIILEMPAMVEQEEKEIITNVKKWFI